MAQTGGPGVNPRLAVSGEGLLVWAMDVRASLSRRTALLLSLLVGLAAGETACRRPPPSAAAPPPPAERIERPPITAPAPLSRAEIIAAARSASEAAALGAPYPDAVTKLVGARFEARLPLGCAGAAPEATVGYSLDAKRGVLTLRARPQSWTQDAGMRALIGQADVESVEGFWMRRPWIGGDACPAIRAGAHPSAPASPETLALVRVFAHDASRVLRHAGRGYEVTRKAEPGVLRLQGFRLVLAGRLADFGGGQPIRCRSAGPDQRPVCAVSVEFDRVTFEDPVSGEVLAEWRS